MVASSTLNRSPYSDDNWPINPLRENPDIFKYEFAERTAFRCAAVRLGDVGEPDAVALVLATVAPAALRAALDMVGEVPDPAVEADDGASLRVCPPSDMPIAMKTSAVMNPPPQRRIALPFKLMDNPIHVRKNPNPAAAAEAIVINVPRPTASSPSACFAPSR